MSEKFVKLGDDLAVVINKTLLKKLKLDQDTNLEVVIENNNLIIKPSNVSRKKAVIDSKKEKTRKLANKIIDKYEPVFKKLAKT